MRGGKWTDQIDVDMRKCLLRDGDVEDRAVVVALDFIDLTGRTREYPGCNVMVHGVPNKVVADQSLGGTDARMLQSVEEVEYLAPRERSHKSTRPPGKGAMSLRWRPEMAMQYA